MADPREVHNLLQTLHERKLINLDSPIRSLTMPNGLGITDPGSLVGWYAVGGDHYVIVCGNQPGTINEAARVAAPVRNVVAPG